MSMLRLGEAKLAPARRRHRLVRGAAAALLVHEHLGAAGERRPDRSRPNSRKTSEWHTLRHAWSRAEDRRGCQWPLLWEMAHCAAAEQLRA